MLDFAAALQRVGDKLKTRRYLHYSEDKLKELYLIFEEGKKIGRDLEKNKC